MVIFNTSIGKDGVFTLSKDINLGYILIDTQQIWVHWLTDKSIWNNAIHFTVVLRTIDLTFKVILFWWDEISCSHTSRRFYRLWCRDQDFFLITADFEHPCGEWLKIVQLPLYVRRFEFKQAYWNWNLWPGISNSAPSKFIHLE